MPWDAWGPESTRWFSSTDFGRIFALWGYRVVEIFNDELRTKVRVKDFNRYTVKMEFDEQDERWESEYPGASRCVEFFILPSGY
jgi:hypothetical protein